MFDARMAESSTLLAQIDNNTEIAPIFIQIEQAAYSGRNDVSCILESFETVKLLRKLGYEVEYNAPNAKIMWN
jgi:hypothetical protein